MKNKLSGNEVIALNYAIASVFETSFELPPIVIDYMLKNKVELLTLMGDINEKIEEVNEQYYMLETDETLIAKRGKYKVRVVGESFERLYSDKIAHDEAIKAMISKREVFEYNTPYPIVFNKDSNWTLNTKEINAHQHNQYKDLNSSTFYLDLLFKCIFIDSKVIVSNQSTNGKALINSHK